MLHVGNPPLDSKHAEQLKKYQEQVDQKETYADRVATGKKLFSSRNNLRNTTFAKVRSRLVEMCSGAERCHYCEDSAGDQIEHFRPKDLYPEFVFAWNNFLLACGKCNRSKKNDFMVVVGQRLIDVTRRPGAAVKPPAYVGDAAPIDPRREDPLNYLFLDLVGTFVFLPIVGLDALDAERARYTIDLLALNRDLLLAARREAYGSYRARLTEYRQLRDNGGDGASLRIMSQAIAASAHPTVWYEMQRWHSRIPELQRLFSDVPEALEWRRTPPSR